MGTNLAAVIQERGYPHLRNLREYVAWIYDKDKPRDLDAEDPCARYACVSMLGPFRTKDAAIRACHAIGIGD